MSPHDFILLYLVRRQQILRRSLHIIVVRAYTASIFAAQFIDSHPVLTPHKIMSDCRLMLSEYRKLCVTSLYLNDPLMSSQWFFDAVASNRWNSCVPIPNLSAYKLSVIFFYWNYLTSQSYSKLFKVIQFIRVLILNILIRKSRKKLFLY